MSEFVRKTTLTRQEVFDTVVRQLRSQGWRQSRVNGEGGCAYRGPDGMKCAAGALIKDEHYKPYLESHNTTYTSVQDALMKSGVNPLDISMVGVCQSYHDTSHTPAEMETRFRECAADYNLEFPTE